MSSSICTGVLIYYKKFIGFMFQFECQALPYTCKTKYVIHSSQNRFEAKCMANWLLYIGSSIINFTETSVIN